MKEMQKRTWTARTEKKKHVLYMNKATRYMEQQDEDEEFKMWSHSNNNIDMNFIGIHTISSWNATWMKCMCASTNVFVIFFKFQRYVCTRIFSIIRLERTLWFQLTGEENKKLDFHCLYLTRVAWRAEPYFFHVHFRDVAVYWIQIMCICI